MPFTLTMPKLSPTMEEGTIAKWHKKIGDQVQSGELIAEIATDKASVEYNALDEGYVRILLINEGGSAAVGAPIAVMTEEKDESIEGYTPEGVSSGAPPAEKSAEATPEQQPAQKTQDAAPQPTSTSPQAPGLSQPAFTPAPPLSREPIARRMGESFSS